ncbi:MAG: gliding motility-associated C-terminal domain-containing protein [Crocinitomicaceae bacterium]
MKKIVQIAILLGGLSFANQVFSQTVQFPNVITPNGDGINDFFYVTCTGYVQMEGVILNRRGEPITNFYGINARWDGRNSSGERVMDGVYFYKIVLTREDGEQESFMGNIQVLGRK